MAHDWQIVMDAADPHVLADFWAAALKYQVEQNGPLIEGLIAAGRARKEDTVVHNGVLSWADLAAIGHPDDAADRVRGSGSARRLLLQRVPEAKTTKNRVHLDISVGADRRAGEVQRLVGLGASVMTEVDDRASRHTVMTDPEGNEFCVQ